MMISEDMQYGIIQDALNGLKGWTQEIGKALENISSLEVRTYACDDMDNAGYDPNTKQFTGGAKLKAYTRIELDGDQVTLLPEKVDGDVQKLHMATVVQAQQNRKAFLDTVLGILDLKREGETPASGIIR